MNFVLTNRRRNRFQKPVIQVQPVPSIEIKYEPECNNEFNELLLLDNDHSMSFLSVIVRYFNDPYICEFVEYYLSEGVDMVYIVNDNDSTQTVPESLLDNKKVTIWYSQFDEASRKEYHKNQMYFCNLLYSKVRFNSTWFIVIDSDEFINTRRNFGKTIRDELMTTFKDVDCIKVPWIMMASNGLEKDPPSLLQGLPYRWNHDVRHPNPTDNYKSKCWYDYIHCKCIFKSEKFESFHNHAPNFESDQLLAVDSIHGCKYDPIYHPYDNLREADIQVAFFICNHYRIISKESCIRKCIENKLPGYQSDFSSLLIADYPEIHDESLKNKSISRFGIKNS